MIPNVIIYEVTCPNCKRMFFVEFDVSTLELPRYSVTLRVSEGHVVTLNTKYYIEGVDHSISAAVTHCPRENLGGNK